MADLRAARRYATALFGVAVRQNELETVERDLNAVVDLWEQNPQISAAMGRPQVPTDVKRRILQQVLGDQVQPLLLRFVLLLLDKIRIDLLPDVRDEFQRLADEHRNIVRAQVTTAVPLSPELAQALRIKLGSREGKIVGLIPVVDPSIMGGVILRVGDRIMDGSVRGRLETLRRQLSGRR